MSEWRVIPSWDAYEVSDQGEIRRLRPGMGATVGKILKLGLSKRGYLKFGAFQDGKANVINVHTALAEAFIGPRPDGYEVDHKDENKLNNVIDNLQYLSKADHNRKRLIVSPDKNYLHNLIPFPRKHSKEVMEEAVLRFRNGVPANEIAQELKMSGRSIYRWSQEIGEIK